MTVRAGGALIAFAWALAVAAPVGAADSCAVAGDAVATQVAATCDCCSPFRRCVKDIVRADADAGTLPLSCRRQARRDGRVACRAIRRTGCRLHWYRACDGPVACGQSFRPAPTCGPTELLGTACDTVGALCNPASQTCSQLQCLPVPPEQCPISRRAFKRDVRYLDATEVEALRAQVLALKLARYRYTTDPDATPSRLGFMIDDAPDTPAVAADATHVDLYGYASMVAAAVQAQEKEIAALRRAVARLERAASPRAAAHGAGPSN